MKWIFSAMIAGFALLPALAQPTGGGWALSFDGVDSYVAIATTGSLTGTFTVELWANANSTELGTLISSRFLNGGGEFSFDMGLGAWLPNGTARIHSDIGNGSYWITAFADADFAYSIGTWHHFAYVVTPTVYSIYADGILVGTGAVSEGDALLFDEDHPLGIGWSGFPNTLWSGQISEVRIWSTARSGEEIQANMHRTLAGSEPGLAGYWPFDEGSGDTAIDASGHGFDGTLIGGLDWVTSTAPIGPGSAVGPPLSISSAGSVILVWWPASASGFTLETSPGLGGIQAWTRYTAPVRVIGDQNVAALVAGTGQKLFRLHQP